ncbi:TVP38/TMEM64 family protein [Candidatus Nitrospira neomarina]|uniref:TVP38/TMEM64 family membrane protein n=1 Tax=Candidatus Nitrospira neomarina TaxID=3020899 RepID=A0AA96K564_9BACT|nr:VTT domain-containing protein [Candidatus Nitrospira neomarina]WNM64139.1 VTT domain-containing protein [Candidatus Nitrospira neomarina]
MTSSILINNISLFRLLKWTVGSIIVLSLVFMLPFEGLSILSSGTLEHHYAHVRTFSHDHYALSVMLYIGLYCFLAALSLPGKLMLTLAAGHFFGTVLGTVYILWGATTGAALAFLGARYVFREAAQETFTHRLPAFHHTLKSKAFSTLLILRLLPVVPFTILNLLAGLTPITFNTFLWATVIGILPCALFLSYLGSQMAHLLPVSDWAPDSLILPVSGLALLALIPLAYLSFTCQKKFVEAGASSGRPVSRSFRPDHSKITAIHP